MLLQLAAVVSSAWTSSASNYHDYYQHRPPRRCTLHNTVKAPPQSPDPLQPWESHRSRQISHDLQTIRWWCSKQASCEGWRWNTLGCRWKYRHIVIFFSVRERLLLPLSSIYLLPIANCLFLLIYLLIYLRIALSTPLHSPPNILKSQARVRDSETLRIAYAAWKVRNNNRHSFTLTPVSLSLSLHNRLVLTREHARSLGKGRNARFHSRQKTSTHDHNLPVTASLRSHGPADGGCTWRS